MDDLQPGFPSAGDVHAFGAVMGVGEVEGLHDRSSPWRAGDPRSDR
jgi:hypothetical protein